MFSYERTVRTNSTCVFIHFENLGQAAGFLKPETVHPDSRMLLK
jgi:hypothetical protein